MTDASYPDHLRYHEAHDWVDTDGDIATFGITWYAQDSLGEVVYFSAPEVGSTVAKDGDYGELESTKAVKADLGLRAVVAAEQIIAGDDEVDAEIIRLAERSGRKPAQLRKEIERGQGLQAVRSELSRGKALQFLVDHATVVDEEGKPLDISFPEPAPEALAEEPEEESQS